MKPAHLFDKIDLQLIRTLHTLLIERSVSKAALRLGQQQPAVSTALRRLRELTGDPILVRSGTGMVPTDAALQMLVPVTQILQAAEQLFMPARPFEAAQARETFRIAASASSRRRRIARWRCMPSRPRPATRTTWGKA